MAVGGAGILSESLWNGLLDDNGEMLSSGNVYVYQAGTVTASTLYTTSTMGTAHANPLVLDAYGRAVAYGNRDYKFVVTDSAGSTLYTLDNIQYNYWKEDNDGTTTGLDADLLDARHAGNTYDYIPVSNGTVCDELNADELDGYDAGNATGNVPVSNGTRNEGLNAEYLGTASTPFSAGNATGNIPLNNGTYNAGLNAAYLNGSTATAFLSATSQAICWAEIDTTILGPSTPAIYDSQGISTIVYNAVGDWALVFSTSYAGAHTYVTTAGGYDNTPNPVIAAAHGQSAGSVNIHIITHDSTATNPTILRVFCVGEQ